MTGTSLIAVSYKKTMTDPVAQGLLATLRHLDLPKPKRVTTSQLFRLNGTVTPEHRLRISRDLLCDPVIQDALEDGARETSKERKSRGGANDQKGSYAVDIWYKAGVTDVSGASVEKGISDLGITTVAEVRTGMRYRFWGLKNKDAAQKLAVSLLANPLVQDILVHAD